MKWVYKKDHNRLPIKSWCEYVEDGAIQQAINLSNHPSLVDHVALMPDCHQGYGMPIGGVIATHKAVIPNAVGVDIGCGMCAVQTDFPAEHVTKDDLRLIIDKIKDVVPVGFEHHDHDIPWSEFQTAPNIPIINQELKSARKQLGTLGGGNHFIEIQKGDDDCVWLMVHSGSRNFGYKIANEYHKQALKLNKLWKSELPDKDLAFLPIESVEGKQYMEAMNFALLFAEKNRKLIMDRVVGVVYNVLNCGFKKDINIHHNYAAWENHHGKNLKKALLAVDLPIPIQPQKPNNTIL